MTTMQPLTIVSHAYVTAGHIGITVLAAQPSSDLVRFILSGPFGVRYGAVRTVQGEHGPCEHLVPIEERPGDAARESWVGLDEVTSLVDYIASPVADQSRGVWQAIMSACDEARTAV